MIAYPQSVTSGLTQAMGTKNISVDGLADTYQITIIPSSGATGSVAFQARVDKIAPFETVYDSTGATAVSINLASTKLTFTITNIKLESINVLPTSVVGSYSVLVKPFGAN